MFYQLFGLILTIDHLIKSVPMKKQTHLHLGWPFQQIFIFGRITPLISNTDVSELTLPLLR